MKLRGSIRRKLQGRINNHPLIKRLLAHTPRDSVDGQMLMLFDIAINEAMETADRIYRSFTPVRS